MQLTPDQLATIDRHLRKENWLLNEDLIAELTDHYTTAISNRMTEGQAFSESLIDVYKGFGWRKGLLKMEEEYGIQKKRQTILMAWREVKPFFVGQRTPITVAIFAGLYQLDFLYAGRDMAKSFFSTGEMFLIIGFCTSFFIIMIWELWQSRANGENWFSFAGRKVTPFVRIYSICYAVLLCSKFVWIIFSWSLPAVLAQFVGLSLQTSTAVYFMGSTIALYKRPSPKVKAT